MKPIRIDRLVIMSILAGSVLATVLSGRLAAQTDPCADLIGAQKGICTAYCPRCLDDMSPGRGCDALRNRWERLTGSELLPCDPPPRPLCGDATAPACGGSCPTGARCVADGAGTACYCERRCGTDRFTNICGGACPPGLTCREGADGCRCAQPGCGFRPDSTSPTDGTCGGPCPPGETCQDTATGCQCEPPPCGLLPNTTAADRGPRCGGACPDPADTCTLVNTADGAIGCTCATLGCGLNPFTGQCGGDCPAGLNCRAVPGTANWCTCEPPPTGCARDLSTGACGGDCPTGTTCAEGPNGCACQPG